MKRIIENKEYNVHGFKTVIKLDLKKYINTTIIAIMFNMHQPFYENISRNKIYYIYHVYIFSVITCFGKHIFRGESKMCFVREIERRKVMRS